MAQCPPLNTPLARGQSLGQGHKKFRAKDRSSRGQGHRRKCSPKKKFSKKFFQAKKVFKNFFPGDLHLRKTKKVLAHFAGGFWRFPTKFQRFKK